MKRGMSSLTLEPSPACEMSLLYVPLALGPSGPSSNSSGGTTESKWRPPTEAFSAKEVVLQYKELQDVGRSLRTLKSPPR